MRLSSKLFISSSTLIETNAYKANKTCLTSFFRQKYSIDSILDRFQILLTLAFRRSERKWKRKRESTYVA